MRRSVKALERPMKVKKVRKNSNTAICNLLQIAVLLERNRRESGSLQLHQRDRQQCKLMPLSHSWRSEISFLWLMLIRFYGKSALLSHSALRPEADSITHCNLCPCNL